MEGVTTALGLLEVESIARGYTTTDAMVKKAAVRLLESRPVSPGKYVILVNGDVGEVDESMRAGVAAAGDSLIDQLFLPQAHEQLPPLLAGARPTGVPTTALAVLETSSVCSTVLAADAAAKAAEVHLLEMRL